MSSLKEELVNLLKPYLRDESNADYLALKIERLHEEYLEEMTNGNE